MEAAVFLVRAPGLHYNERGEIPAAEATAAWRCNLHGAKVYPAHTPMERRAAG